MLQCQSRANSTALDWRELPSVAPTQKSGKDCYQGSKCLGQQPEECLLRCQYHVVSSALHSSDRIGGQGKRTSDRARTRDLRSIAEFQPREPSILVKIPRTESPLTGVPLSSGCLRPAPGTACGVVVARSAATSMLHRICEPDHEMEAASLCVSLSIRELVANCSEQ